ncbi:MAG: sulfide/dihydroorotate dehydrogenase-like FAD/NAD-binding protein [Epulopiscium sp.]|nr:sulfide/dihydroorotate dehydrogenase-like FAD/NAD-binding protein [Candidatus Epulonipiscium sp.]
MYKIVERNDLAPNIFLMKILAPRVAKSAQPGQFIIIRIDEKGERIPLTICDYDREEGTVSIVVQALGSSTKKMEAYQAGDYFADFVGPLGVPSEFTKADLSELKKKKIVFIAGGVGVAPVYPQAKWMHEHGIDVDIIIGARTKELLILEEQMSKVGNLHLSTDDGSYGYHGRVTDVLEDLVKNQGKQYDQAIAIGPMIMMKFVCILTKKLGIPTVVSLNPIMVDGTGMCGACRVTVGGETKFACVDGPEFDGHLVDFDEAIQRQAQYKKEEHEHEHHHHHKNGKCHIRGEY